MNDKRDNANAWWQDELDGEDSVIVAVDPLTRMLDAAPAEDVALLMMALTSSGKGESL